MFEKEVYTARRKALLERLAGEKGVAVLLGNVDAPAQYKDNCYKWRQDSNWLYFFGIDEPRFAATIDLESGEETIYADDFSIDDIIWTGPMPSVKTQAEAVGVCRTAPYSALKEAVRGRKVHFLPTSRYYNAMLMASLLGLDPSEVTSAGKKGCAKASRPLTDAVIAMRLVKEDREIAQIDHACDIGYEMHTAARRGIVPGIIEQEIVGRMEGVTLSKGWGVSFATILTQHGEIFHCHSHEGIVEPGRLMVIDAGAENNMHYASDFTRTYPTSGKFSAMQRDIYQTVYECNELAFGMIRPGIAYRDVHLAVAEHILDNLGQLGLVNGNPTELAADGIAGLFMPHGLGHNMGLDVHDMEDLGEDLVGYDADQKRSEQLGLGSLRMARRLMPGNVITDEPGIYFIPDLIRLWKREGTDRGCVNYSKLEPYFSFGGIRLEDDVLVTADGARRLGAKRLPIAPDEVEAAMSKDQY
ncbi:MAG TPA: aminopeptidase P N-terminal domain-containing protein [Candidatus Cryptobacteroides excrementigallinarum]|nr:aminopeptidase P N-terminal domain-containing protein [Candidatus Cryptobacteroides excrementigallinarum]